MNEVLEIQISHVSTKNEETIGLLERTERQIIKTALKRSTFDVA